MSVNNSRRMALKAGAVSLVGLTLPFAMNGVAWAKDTGLLSVAIPSNPQTLDPINQPNHDVMAINQLIFENLVGVDADGQRVPELARSWTMSTDKLTYSFDLQPDVVFQNGQPFTSADVKYSFDYVLNPANKAFRRSFWTVIDTISTPNAHTVVIRLKRPYRPFLDYMSKYMGIFANGSREQYPGDYFKLTPIGVGTGPGIFVQMKSNDFVELKRNPTYWKKGLPLWETVRFQIIPEESSRLAAILSNQVQIISAPPTQTFSAISHSAGMAGASKASPTSPLMICLNTKKAPFDDANFRQAVALVLDRDRIAKSLCYGAIRGSSMPFASDSPYYDEASGKELVFDMAKARSLLKASKYPTGASFDLMYVQPAYLIDTASTALYVQAQLAGIGVTVNLHPLDFGQMISQVLVGNHAAALTGFIAPPEPTYLLNAIFRPSESLWKATGYDNPALIKAIDDSYLVEGQQALKPVLTSMQQIIAHDCPAIWIGSIEVQNLWKKGIQNFSVNTGFSLQLEKVSPVKA